VPSSVRATAHRTATSRPVSEEDEDAAGTAFRTLRASPDSPLLDELRPAADVPLLLAPAPADLFALLSAAWVPFLAEPFGVGELVADPGRLLASPIAR
jgi:hypothetical protein